jgi:hypothetical protein
VGNRINHRLPGMSRLIGYFRVNRVADETGRCLPPLPDRMSTVVIGSRLEAAIGGPKA